MFYAILVVVSHVLPWVIFLLSLRWFARAANSASREWAEKLLYGLFCALQLVMIVLILCSPLAHAISGRGDDDVHWMRSRSLIETLSPPYLVKLGIVPGNKDAFGVLDYFINFRKMGVDLRGDLVEYWTIKAHLTGALAWVLCMPLQFNGPLRRRAKPFHRMIGRVGILASVVTAVTGGYMSWTKGGSVDGILPGSTFDRALKGAEQSTFHGLIWPPIAIYTLYGAFKTYWHARRRELVQHKVWAVRHVTGGLGVGLMRVIGIYWTQLVFPTLSTGDGLVPVFPLLILFAYIFAVGFVEMYIQCFLKAPLGKLKERTGRNKS